MEANFKYIGKGLYNISEASKLTGVTWARVRHWIRGDKRNPEGSRNPMPNLINADYGMVEGKYYLSFLDLIEVLMVEQFRIHGVSISSVRLAYKFAQEEFNQRHPFALNRFWTDRKSILTYVTSETQDEALLNLKGRQFEIGGVTKFFMKEVEIEPNSQIISRWWPLGKHRRVVIDPKRSFGHPIIASEGVPTIVLASAHAAGDTFKNIALWYDVDIESVKDAFKYEKKIGRVAA